MTRKHKLKKAILIGSLSTLTAVQPALQAASSLPTGGNFTAGSGNISASGNVLNINQNSLKGIIDWNTFSIGSSSAVNFNNGSGATLNRVTGLTPSTILGQLQATGSVYILNPQGILIGPSANIHTGGDFLATTLNLSNKDFLSNKPLTFTGPSNATVINLGDLTSTGGSVYLIGHAVSNTGSISAANGTAGLAAGSMVLLTDATNTQHVLVKAPGGDVTNTGFLTAAQVELKSNGGNIYALAGNNGGQINATGTATQDGHIWLIATNGTTSVSGLLSASNSNGVGGNIETSGAHVSTNSATIKTGKNGNWLLDPDDLTIDSALAGTIEMSLNGGTNVTEQTTAPVSGGNGDILVTSPITWGTGANLTLSAYHDINVAAAISNTGSGNLTLRADNTSTGAGTITGSGLIDWSASTGNVALLYNPSSYATPHDYSSNFGSVNGAWTAPADNSVSSQYTAYMLINSAANLQNLDANDAGTYALGKDIDLSTLSLPFTPLGLSAPYFTGILDGMGHTVSNLTITTSDYYAGLFGLIGTGGQVRNIDLTNVNITLTGGGNGLAGGLASYSNGTISNASTSGIIHAGTVEIYVGGLVGEQDGGSIQNSHSSVSIDGASNNADSFAGGLVGYVSSGPITNSYATGNITLGNSGYAGGLVGSGYDSITNSYATGNITAGNSGYIGGLAGYVDAPITNSYATGNVTAGDSGYVGGLVSYMDGDITNSYATGNVTGGYGPYGGGLVGYVNSGTISNSYATGNVTAGDGIAYVGGLAGEGGTIINSYATGNVTAGDQAEAGGLVGYLWGTITNSYATGAVTAGANPGGGSAYAGGLVGYASSSYDTTITNSYATGAVVAVGGTAYAGGLVGESSNFPINNSYATGSVTANGDYSYVGGLVGYSASNITSSYATGAVSGTGIASNLGGLVGYSDAGTTDSFASGDVTGANNDWAGGLVGYADTGATISSSYAFGNVVAGDTSFAGGLAGALFGIATDTYAHGSVTAGSNANIGGLIGDYEGTVSNSYSTGHVTSTGSNSLVGGFIGLFDGTILSNDYFDTESTGTTADGGGAAGLTTAQLQNGTLPTGFNGTNAVWASGYSGVYPYFGWQGPLVDIGGYAQNGLFNGSPIAAAGVSALSNGHLIGTTTTNSNGDYDIFAPQNMVKSGVLTYLTSGGTANSYSDGGSSYYFSNMDLINNSLFVFNSTQSTLSGIAAALKSTVGNFSGSNFLFSTPNGQLTLVPSTNLALLSNVPSFTFDQSPTGTAAIIVQNYGDLIIAPSQSLTASAGNSIYLADFGAFTNNAGPNALNVSDGGTWRVLSPTPLLDTPGGLPADYIQYNAGFQDWFQGTYSGNGLLYYLAPTITPTLVGNVTKTYDGTTAATLTAANFGYTVSSTGGPAISPANFNLNGAIPGDTITLNTPTSGTYDDPNVHTGGAITATGISIASAYRGNIPIYGYQLATDTAVANIGDITPATLFYVADPASLPYGGTVPAFTGTVTGFVNNETLASATTGTLAFNSEVNGSSPSGSYAINGSGLTANHGNYVFVQAPGNASALTVLTVNPPPPPPSPEPTTLSISVNNATALSNQMPVFTSTYTGSPIDGLDLSSILASLSYQISPAFSGAGVYQITATGTAPDGYVFNFTPGIFTVVDSTPKTLGSQVSLFPPVLPDLLTFHAAPGSLPNLLQPVNAMGLFQINVNSMLNSGYGVSAKGFGLTETPLAQSPFFKTDKSDTYVAGAKP